MFAHLTFALKLCSHKRVEKTQAHRIMSCYQFLDMRRRHRRRLVIDTDYIKTSISIEWVAFDLEIRVYW